MALVAMGLVGSLLGTNARAATTYYFDPNGATAGYGIANGGTYSWDDPSWTTTSGGGAATSNWVQGGFAKFAGGVSGNSYTVTVSGDEQVAGLYQSVSGVNLTINAVGSGTLDIASGVQGFLNSSSATLTINAPMSGVGGFEPQNGGNIYVTGTNTYTGGTTLVSSSTLINFNNGSAFGTGAITNTLGSGSFAPLLAYGGKAITLANDFVNTVTGGGINFAASANTPVTSTGNWNLGTATLSLRNNGNSTSPLTLTGMISGSGGLTLSGANGGTITLTGSNGYSGVTTVGLSGAAAITLKLGAESSIANTSSLVMAGGTFNPGGFNQDMSLFTTLGMTANSTFTFAAGAAEVDFANSSTAAWTGTLNITGWDSSVDKLRFGGDATGLTAAQLAEIEFNGNASTLGSAGLDASGYLVQTPEPASLSLLGVAGVAMLARRRRKA